MVQQASRRRSSVQLSAATSRAARVQQAAATRKAQHTRTTWATASSERTLLERNAVRGSSDSDYGVRVQAFLQWAGMCSASSLGLASLQLLILEYFEHLFFLGKDYAEGAKLVAAIAHFRVGLSPRCAQFLPRCARALQGWRLLAPASSRQPLPWLGLMALVGSLLSGNHVAEALACLLGFHLYLRPGELLGLTGRCLVAPSRRPGAPWTWGVIVRPLEENVPSKVGEFDESVLVDRPAWRWLHPFMLLLADRNPDQLIWPFSPPSSSGTFTRRQYP